MRREDPGALHLRPLLREPRGAEGGASGGRPGDARAFDAVSRMWRHEGGYACLGTWLGAPPWRSSVVRGCVEIDVGRLAIEPSSLVDLHTGAGPADYEICPSTASPCASTHRASRRRRAATRRGAASPSSVGRGRGDGSPRLVFRGCSRGAARRRRRITSGRRRRALAPEWVLTTCVFLARV